MNRLCHADIFHLDERSYLRCRLNGSFYETRKPKKILFCPYCSRKIEVSGEYSDPEMIKVIKIYHPGFRCFVKFLSKILSGPEEV